MKGLPFVDPYIISEWEITEVLGTCHAHITLRFEYDKISWLQSMVESNSHSELIKFFEAWELYLAETLQILKEKDELDTYSGLQYLKDLFPKSDIVKSAVAVADHITEPQIDHMQADYMEEPPTYILLPSSSSPGSNDVRKSFIHEKLNMSYNDVERICLSGLQEHSGIKMCVVVIISLYAKIEVATFHGLKIDNIYRILLDQSASMSLIYCLIALVEVVARVSIISISSYFSSESSLRSASLSKVSRSTQTDPVCFQSQFPLHEIKPDPQAVENASPSSETACSDTTWRDCEIEEMMLSTMSKSSWRNF